jgi:hypothetical protein
LHAFILKTSSFSIFQFGGLKDVPAVKPFFGSFSWVYTKIAICEATGNPLAHSCENFVFQN